MKNKLIKMEGIKKSFNIGKENELEILHGIDFDVNEGEFVSVVGQSGSGKSTFTPAKPYDSILSPVFLETLFFIFS